MLLKIWFRVRRRVVRRRRVKNTVDGARYKKLKEEARVFVNRKLREFALQHGFTYNTVAIRNQSTRWGSCSKKGNLNFNYKIVLLPPHLADYVICHELCHLRQFNHSKKFWDLLGTIIPNAIACKRELQKMHLHLL